MRSGQSIVLEQDESRFSLAVSTILDGAASAMPRKRNQGRLVTLSNAVGLSRYICAFQLQHPVPLKQLWRQAFPGADWSDESVKDFPHQETEMMGKVREFVANSQTECDRYATEWTAHLAPWSSVVESGRRLFGERWTFAIIASAAGRIKNREEQCRHATHFHDHHVPLCERIRFARLRAGAPGWWREQIETAQSHSELLVALLVFACWAGPTTITGLWGLFEERLTGLPLEEWHKLANAIRKLVGDGSDVPRLSLRPIQLPSNISERAAVCFYWQVKNETRTALFDACFRDYAGDDLVVLEHCQMEALRSARQDSGSWHSLLPLIRRCYSRGAIADRYWGAAFQRGVAEDSPPEDVAQMIVKTPDQYPSIIVAMAESKMRQKAISSIDAVGNVATRDKWFD